MTDDLRDRIINAIWDDLIVQRDSDIPFAPSVSRSDSYIDGEVDIESVADAVIRELRQEWRADYGYDGYSNCTSREEAQEHVDDFNEHLGDDWQDGEQAMILHRYTTDWEAADE